MTLTKRSLFSQVVQLNQMAGNRPEFSWKQLAGQFKIVESEFEELSEALEKGDVLELADAIVDLQVTVLGLAWMAGLDNDTICDHVLACLRTRIDTNAKRAGETRDYYMNRGTDCYIRTSYLPEDVDCTTPFFAVISSKDQPGAPAGKWLKSIHRIEANLREIIPHDNLK